VLTMVDQPADTTAGMWQTLEHIPGPMVISLTWQRVDNDVMRRLLNRRRLFMFADVVDVRSRLATGAAGANKPVLTRIEKVSSVDSHGDAIKAMEEQGLVFGSCTLTIVLADADRAAVDKRAAAVKAVLASHDALLHLEAYNAVYAWLTVVPGHHVDLVRQVKLPATAMADLSPTTFSRDPGPRVGADGRPAILTLETPHGGWCHLLSEIGIAPHTLILGSVGTGKSVTGNALTLFGQAVYQRTVIYDIGGSYRNLCTALGGSYIEFDLARPVVPMNPFAGDGRPEHVDFLQAWVQMLLRGQDHYVVTSEARDFLVDRIRGVMAKPPDRRRLTTLRYSLSQELRDRLAQWCEGGLYGSLFDHIEDGLVDHPFQVFDMKAIYRHHQEVTGPLFAFLSYREREWQSRALSTTLHVIEEVWLAAEDPMLKALLLYHLKGGRKDLVSVVLITQSLADLAKTGIRAEVLESCARTIFLPTDHFDRDEFRAVFKLTAEELELLEGLTPRLEFLLKEQQRTRVCQLRLDPETLAICVSQPIARRPYPRAVNA
jgi:type IV secretory pathway VirB4 component